MKGEKGEKLRVAVLGASGYTGADAVRLLARHPRVELVLLSAHSHAGQALAEIFPHLGGLNLPHPQRVEEVAESAWDEVDAVFSCLPHGVGQDVLARLAGRSKRARLIDLSADFRLHDVGVYARWYGRAHAAPELQREAVYGLSEVNGAAIAGASLVACPGCYPTAVLLGLLPLVASGSIVADDIVIDAKSGVSGAGRGVKESLMFAEVAEGMQPYAVAAHRHMPEIEQELSRTAGREVVVSFTPHLIPINRGELTCSYARLAAGVTAAEARARLWEAYAGAEFVQCLEEGAIPSTRHVRGSNFCRIALFEDRIPGRVIVVAALDNLVKGSSGQAIQNMNLMFGFDEREGLDALPLCP